MSKGCFKDVIFFFKSVSKVFQEFSKVIQECFNEISWVRAFQGCSIVGVRLLQGCIMEVSKVCQEFSQEGFNNVS